MGDLSQLGKDLGNELTVLLKDGLEGAEEDVRRWGAAIGEDMLKAVMAGDDAWRTELVEQGKVMLEINRVRLTERGQGMVDLAIKALVTGAKVALAKQS